MTSRKLKNDLIVDLDGTLLSTDMLEESFLQLLKSDPLWVLKNSIKLIQSKAKLKALVAEKYSIDPANLPYNREVLDLIGIYKKAGQRVYLATGSNRKLAEHISKFLGVFDGVYASSEVTNLIGIEKQALLRKKHKKFDYVGNHKHDIPIWQAADNRYLVGHVRHKLLNKVPNLIEITKRKRGWAETTKIVIKQLRVHQWVKNFLMFVPIFTSHRFGETNSWIALSIGVISFSFAASCVYLINDLFDLDHDRKHESKRRRPIAQGQLSISTSLLLIVLSACIAALTSIMLPSSFQVVLIVYLISNLIYSIYLKKVIVLDIVMLAGLYTMRIVAGALLISEELSFWIVAFSIFVFLALALVKRYSEIIRTSFTGKSTIQGRSYLPEDKNVVLAFGSASSFTAMAFLALYINSAEIVELYAAPSIIWAIIPILLSWLLRIWILANRGQVDQDPVMFAIRDRFSAWSAIAVALVYLAASFVDLT